MTLSLSVKVTDVRPYLSMTVGDLRQVQILMTPRPYVTILKTLRLSVTMCDARFIRDSE